MVENIIFSNGLMGNLGFTDAGGCECCQICPDFLYSMSNESSSNCITVWYWISPCQLQRPLYPSASMITQHAPSSLLSPLWRTVAHFLCPVSSPVEGLNVYIWLNLSVQVPHFCLVSLKNRVFLIPLRGFVLVLFHAAPTGHDWSDVVFTNSSNSPGRTF